MLGLFGTLNMGARSLEVQQQATEVAGQNLANVNNAAYSRQQVNLQTTLSLDTPQGEEGTGVQNVSITQVTSSILNGQIQSEGGISGSLNSQQSALQDAEAQLQQQITTASGSGSAISTTGLASSLSNLFGSFQSLSTDPSNLADRQTVIASAQNLTQTFNSISNGLSAVRSGINSSITSDVATVNQDLSDIADLNQQIILAQAKGETSNDLNDLREQKLEDLSSKVNITTSPQTDGAINISVAGVDLVQGGSTTNRLQTVAASNGDLSLIASSGAVITPTSGSIEGTITARDGALSTLQNSLDSLASQVATQVNNVYSTGYDLKGNTGQNLFTGTTAGTIGVNSSLVANPSSFQASGSASDTGDNTVIAVLAKLSSQSISGLSNQTFTQSYSQTVAGLGSSIATVNDQLNNSTAVSQMLASQKASVSGVSTDEEMTNLVTFQKAYQASAELISTVNEMLETLISMKTV